MNVNLLEERGEVFYYLMGFLTPTPPKLDTLPDGLHITYLHEMTISDENLPAFVADVEEHLKKVSPIELQIHEEIHYYGAEGEYPVRLVQPDPHVTLHEALLSIVKRHDAQTALRYKYSPHITDADMGCIHSKIEHLSLVQHEGEIGLNSRNIRNFMFGT